MASFAALAKLKMTKEQRAWCRLYQEQTTFEPLMDDFFSGNCTFVEAARRSNNWFESWSSDAFLAVSHHVPGADEEPLRPVDRTTHG